LAKAGFSLSPVQKPRAAGEAVCCRRDGRETIIGIDADSKWPQQKFIVIAYPPYSWRPWRWVGDERFFGQITAVIDAFDVEVDASSG